MYYRNEGSHPTGSTTKAALYAYSPCFRSLALLGLETGGCSSRDRYLDVILISGIAISFGGVCCVPGPLLCSSLPTAVWASKRLLYRVICPRYHRNEIKVFVIRLLPRASTISLFFLFLCLPPIAMSSEIPPAWTSTSYCRSLLAMGSMSWLRTVYNLQACCP